MLVLGSHLGCRGFYDDWGQSKSNKLTSHDISIESTEMSFRVL